MTTTSQAFSHIFPHFIISNSLMDKLFLVPILKNLRLQEVKYLAQRIVRDST